MVDRVSAIIVAAGSGIRLGLSTPKAFVRIADKSLLQHVLQTISAVETIDEVVIAVPAHAQKLARAEVNAVELQVPVKIVEGGATRQDSVRRALMFTSAESGLVVIHDAARPFATPALFSACIDAAAQTGAAIAATPVSDTLKRADEGIIVGTVPREGLWQAQTPQAFRRELLRSAHERALREQFAATDDAHLCERLGIAISVVQGSALNLKVTTPDDLAIGEAMVRFALSR
jgi:2-C-methyl-D-erythritol 4-phosphate cytidylyltransferase